MRRRTHLVLSRLGITGITAAALVGGAVVARAEPSADLAPAPGAVSGFTLNNATNSAQLSYRHARELQICDATASPTGTPSALSEVQAAASRGELLPLVNAPVPFGKATSVPLQVSYRGVTDQIAPGACYRLHASHVAIAALTPLPPGSSVQGSVEWIPATR
ncbi:MAG TPA: hypothetical protein VMD49_00125 [Steroidobacteraceae bacterium]|nr:hypothetical protein [Steroidobacteraceae bacterium]